MQERNSGFGSAPASARLATTLIASAWGLSAAYILFYSLLISHDPRPCFASLVPLVAVWGAIERKRWGRLALLGLSATALGLFVAAIGYAFAVGAQVLTPERLTLQNYIEVALRLYARDHPETAVLILILAATTGFWMRRPAVVAEYERGKKATLAIAQRAIAMSLVGFWGLSMVFTPLSPKEINQRGKTQNKRTQERKENGTKSAPQRKRTVSSRNIRSVADVSIL